jgi:hypothetical protein
MSNDVNCGLTAGFLDSGHVLANASNAAAIVAGIGCIIAGPACGRWVLGGSFLFWFVECWFAIRVSIDSSLFRVLAVDPVDAGRKLDAMLSRPNAAPLPPGDAPLPPGAAPFRTATVRDRPLEDRTRGAMKLWRKQIAALAMQLATLTAGIVLRVANI